MSLSPGTLHSASAGEHFLVTIVEKPDSCEESEEACCLAEGEGERA